MTHSGGTFRNVGIGGDRSPGGNARFAYDVLLHKPTAMTVDQLTAGANLASGALADGAIAEQVKAVRAAVENKNRFHHDAIFRGIVLSNIPDWVYDVVPREQLEAKKRTIIQERLAKLSELDAAVAQALVMRANIFDIVPVQ